MKTKLGAERECEAEAWKMNLRVKRECEAKGAWIRTKSRERVQSQRCVEMKLRAEGEFEDVWKSGGVAAAVEPWSMQSLASGWSGPVPFGARSYWPCCKH